MKYKITCVNQYNDKDVNICNTEVNTGCVLDGIVVASSEDEANKVVEGLSIMEGTWRIPFPNFILRLVETISHCDDFLPELIEFPPIKVIIRNLIRR